MNNLVVLKNKQATTTSLMVAQKFNKNHQRVMRDIRKLHEELGLSKIGLTKFKEMFQENTYVNSQNKKPPIIRGQNTKIIINTYYHKKIKK